MAENKPVSDDSEIAAGLLAFLLMTPPRRSSKKRSGSGVDATASLLIVLGFLGYLVYTYFRYVLSGE